MYPHNELIYYYVILDVDDPDNLLLPAMTARVEIDTLEKKNILVVDSEVVQTDVSGSYVTIVNPDRTLEKKYVKTGVSNDDYVEILEGVSEGEKVLIPEVDSEDKNSSSNDTNELPF